MKYPISSTQINAFRPKPFYFITTRDAAELTPECIENSLLELKDCGFGGFVLFNKPPIGFTAEDYLSEKWFEMVRLFAFYAKKHRLEMWINDGFDYPPGNVGGRVEAIAPHLKQKHLAFDESGNIIVLEADWGFPAFEDPLSGQLFTQLVYDEYEKHVGEYFGDPIVGFFCDGDNRRVHPNAMFDENHPGRNYFPWADDFEESFLAAYGYSITEHLPSVLKRENSQEAHDYWEHAGHLYQRWFRNNGKWLREHGLLYTGHTGDSSPFLYADAPRSSRLTEGRFSDIQSIFDYPGTDQELLALDGGRHMIRKHLYTPTVIWGKKQNVLMENSYDVTHEARYKQVGSTVYINGKNGAMSEMFAASNFGVSPAQLMQIAAIQIMQGITMVVPHAYHHRFRGSIKYFAPPEFSRQGMLGKSIGELNDEIAELCAMMQMGKSVCPVALLDPTDAIWRNALDSEAHFEAMTALNRLPYGYVICDAEKVASMDFKAAVLAGFSLDDKTLALLASKGIPVLGGHELHKLSNYVPCDVRFEGVGTPHFARKIIDGEEFVFVANIENEADVEGTLCAYGKQMDICLPTGKVVYLSENYDSIPKKETGQYIADIPKQTPVRFLDDNIVPLERFDGAHGEAVLKTAEEDALTLKFFSKEALSGLKLYIPIGNIVKEASLNGKQLSYVSSTVYDDAYAVYGLPETAIGENVLTIKKDGAFFWYDRIFLKGDFDVDVSCGDDSGLNAFKIYNLTLNIPLTARITLAKRRETLKTDLSWALQGQCFYSGSADYLFDVELPEDGIYRLTLPKVRDVAELFVEDTLVSKRIKYPYDLTFHGEKGKSRLTLRISNSLANAFECYPEESGILAGGILEKL